MQEYCILLQDLARNVFFPQLERSTLLLVDKYNTVIKTWTMRLRKRNGTGEFLKI